MKKILVTLLLITTLQGCKKYSQEATELPSQLPSPSITPQSSQEQSPNSSSAASSPSAIARVRLIADKYYTTEAERELILRAEKKMNEVVHSKCFYDFMSSRKMIQIDGKTPKQVADEFASAAGDIPVKFYYSRFTSTRAYRQPPSNVININRKFIGPDSDICEVAGTFAHESIGHSLLNYGHDMQWSPSREFSAPYSSDHAFASEPYSMSDSGGCCK